MSVNCQSAVTVLWLCCSFEDTSAWIWNITFQIHISPINKWSVMCIYHKILVFRGIFKFTFSSPKIQTSSFVGYPQMVEKLDWFPHRLFHGQCFCLFSRHKQVEACPIFSGHWIPYHFSGQVPKSLDIHVVQTFPDMSGARPSCRSWPDCSLRPFP